MHTILARRFSAVLTDRTGASPYEDALSVSWFALGLISRAYALDRAQIPRDAVSVDKDATPLKGVAEAFRWKSLLERVGQTRTQIQGVDARSNAQCQLGGAPE